MIQTVAVLGAGTMGHAIANNFASHGVAVHLYESFEEVRKTAKDRIRAELETMVRRAISRRRIFRPPWSSSPSTPSWSRQFAMRIS